MQKTIAVLGTALLLFGLVCPASFVLGLELVVLAALFGQLQRTPISFSGHPFLSHLFFSRPVPPQRTA